MNTENLCDQNFFQPAICNFLFANNMNLENFVNDFDNENLSIEWNKTVESTFRSKEKVPPTRIEKKEQQKLQYKLKQECEPIRSQNSYYVNEDALILNCRTNSKSNFKKARFIKLAAVATTLKRTPLAVQNRSRFLIKFSEECLDKIVSFAFENPEKAKQCSITWEKVHNGPYSLKLVEFKNFEIGVSGRRVYKKRVSPTLRENKSFFSQGETHVDFNKDVLTSEQHQESPRKLESMNFVVSQNIDSPWNPKNINLISQQTKTKEQNSDIDLDEDDFGNQNKIEKDIEKTRKRITKKTKTSFLEEVRSVGKKESIKETDDDEKFFSSLLTLNFSVNKPDEHFNKLDFIIENGLDFIDY